jgi:hypothetical protein
LNGLSLVLISTLFVEKHFLPRGTPKLQVVENQPKRFKLKQVGTGTKIHLDGHSTPIRKFTYAAATREYPKGGCYFSIDVAPSGDGLKVTTFGPLKVISGNPFP